MLYGFGVSVVQLGIQPLVEEAAQEEDRSDRQEGQGPLGGAEARQIEEKDLPEADREQDEAPAAEQSAPPAKSGVQRDQSEVDPARADHRVPSLKIHVVISRRNQL